MVSIIHICLKAILSESFESRDKYIKLHHSAIGELQNNVTLLRGQLISFDQKVSATTETSNRNDRQIKSTDRLIKSLNTTVFDLGLTIGPLFRKELRSVFTNVTHTMNFKHNELATAQLELRGDVMTISTNMDRKINRKEVEDRLRGVQTRATSQNVLLQAIKRQQHKVNFDLNKMNIFQTDTAAKLSAVVSDISKHNTTKKPADKVRVLTTSIHQTSKPCLLS